MGTASVRGRRVDTGEAVSIVIEAGTIASIDAIDDADALSWIGPGLVDVQVNGFAGIDLNDSMASPERVAQLSRELAKVGVTSYLPTIVTAHVEDMERRLAAIASAIAADQLSARMVDGIHLEGPFISPEDGARGAHPLDAVRGPDWNLFARWQAAAGGRIRIVTLSPEWPSSLELIERLKQSGVIVAIGHTAATPEQIRDAVSAGATLSTHLGNGAHAMLPRHPNYLWEQLAADDLWASFIADGFHLPPSVMKTIMRMKGERAILVSDSVALAGMPPGEYESTIGARVVLTPEGRLHLASDPRLLAGSAQALSAGISNLVRLKLATLSEAWAMASTRPLALLELPGRDGLIPGSPADLVAFRLNERFEISIDRVLKLGEIVYQRDERQAQG
jgi:N-acetylglucosamine-6-phosphate deacetylase